ncbi:MAG: SufE family protein [Alphaproteobacteria bacterium]|nr:SufE family protein [Alphaproteobacteria bacterium]
MNIGEIVDNFSLLEDWEERYRYLIDLGGSLPLLPEEVKTEENKVRGCMSQVWMILGWDEKGRLSIRAESDAKIVQGLVAILCTVFQGKTAEEIRSIDIEGIFKKLGLDQHLSPNRRNGFFAMVERIRSFTAQCT